MAKHFRDISSSGEAVWKGLWSKRNTHGNTTVEAGGVYTRTADFCAAQPGDLVLAMERPGAGARPATQQRGQRRCGEGTAGHDVAAIEAALRAHGFQPKEEVIKMRANSKDTSTT